MGFAVHDAQAGLEARTGSVDVLPMHSVDPTWRGLRVRPSHDGYPVESTACIREEDCVLSTTGPLHVPSIELATSIGTIELKDEEASWPHVHKELLGVLLALRSQASSLQNKRVCLFVDATTTVSYLVRWGGKSNRLNQLVRLIWGVCARWGIRIVQVSHISGDRMISAGVDALSRPGKFARRSGADRDDWRPRSVEPGLS